VLHDSHESNGLPVPLQVIDHTLNRASSANEIVENDATTVQVMVVSFDEATVGGFATLAHQEHRHVHVHLESTSDEGSARSPHSDEVRLQLRHDGWETASQCFSTLAQFFAAELPISVSVGIETTTFIVTGHGRSLL
jgi:hypothetical protein